jgi:hypothetical protein
MHLAVFLARRVAQIHEHASERTPTPLPRGKVGTTRRFAPHTQCKSMIPFTPASRKFQNEAPTAQVGLSQVCSTTV